MILSSWTNIFYSWIIHWARAIALIHDSPDSQSWMVLSNQLDRLSSLTGWTIVTIAVAPCRTMHIPRAPRILALMSPSFACVVCRLSRESTATIIMDFWFICSSLESYLAAPSSLGKVHIRKKYTKTVIEKKSYECLHASVLSLAECWTQLLQEL